MCLPWGTHGTVRKETCRSCQIRLPAPQSLGWNASLLAVTYANLLKILKNRKHPEHQSMSEWLGREVDAEAFDVDKTNRWLRKLKWPRVTEARLRKILMGRDD